MKKIDIIELDRRVWRKFKKKDDNKRWGNWEERDKEEK